MRGRAREELESLGVRPRRRLGQTFLVDPRIVERIVAAADVEGKTVLEIGPGLGALSDRLVTKARRLVLVEIDPTMAGRLRERFAAGDRARVIQGDALEVDFAGHLPPDERVVVVANLPYSVASQILVRLFEERRRFARLVLMLQREVAERLIARAGTRAYGVLSVWTALYSDARPLFRVSPAAFHPRPRVDSTVLSLELRREPRVPISDESRFRSIVRASFGQRRKTLRNALSAMASAAEIERAGIDPGRRGETLTLEEFARLANALTVGAGASRNA